MIALGVVLGIICMLAADTDVSGKAWSIVCEATHNVCGAWQACKRAVASRKEKKVNGMNIKRGSSAKPMPMKVSLIKSRDTLKTFAG